MANDSADVCHVFREATSSLRGADWKARLPIVDSLLRGTTMTATITPVIISGQITIEKWRTLLFFPFPSFPPLLLIPPLQFYPLPFPPLPSKVGPLKTARGLRGLGKPQLKSNLVYDI